ncbi:MAG: helix-turn-helix domain-containing protein [Chloroflexota bacterium]
MDEREVLDVEEAAALLGISRWTVRALAKDGKLPARKLGKEWRFSRQALLRYLCGDPGDRKEAVGE